MNAIIRKARHEDALSILTIHSRSIREICSKDYPSSLTEPWSKFSNKESVWVQKMDRDYMWVLEVDRVVMGFAHLAVMNEIMGEVMGLYLLPEIKGQGFGKKLMDVVFNEARTHELKFLSLISTKTARNFYMSLGFKETEGEEFVEINGASIACHPMLLSITNLRPI